MFANVAAPHKRGGLFVGGGGAPPVEGLKTERGGAHVTAGGAEPAAVVSFLHPTWPTSQPKARADGTRRAGGGGGNTPPLAVIAVLTVCERRCWCVGEAVCCAG